MKAILCKEYGPADKLVIEDVPSPEAKGRGVKVRVKAAGLNFPDTLIIEGKYQLKPNMPFSPGGEMAGEVVAVGDKVTRFKVGDRVAGLTGYGAFAEEVIVPEQNLLPDESGGPVRHPQVDDYFEGRDQNGYVPRRSAAN